MLRPGDRLGDLEIVSLVKSGGMASIYLARRSGAAGFTRTVAVKVVHPHLAQDRSFVQMFLDEARLSARIEHPNVVHVEALGEHDGAYFLVMEYVAGCALIELLSALAQRERRLRPELAVWIALQVADGLHAAHETRGEAGERLEIVHRDVSPQNVLLGASGHVKLIDFGIAKALGRAQQTRSGTLRGKLGYMPPEQARGEPLDRRADVYALAVVLWEMLTVQRLFAADDDLALLDQVRAPRVEPPSHYAPEITPALDAALLAALAPERDARTPSAQALRADLVAAVPAAAALDGSHLAALLAELLPDGPERASLPIAQAGTLQTLTVARRSEPPALDAPTPAPVRSNRAVAVVALLAAALLGVLAGATFRPPPHAASRAPAAVVVAPIALAHAPTPPPAPLPIAAPAPTIAAPVPHVAIAPAHRRHHARHARSTRHDGPAVIEDMGL